MEFIENLDVQTYQAFLNQFTHAHFLQSPCYAEARKLRGKNVCYVGIKENGKLIGAALLLKKSCPFGWSYYYSPRGFMLDYHHEALLAFFTKEMKAYLKRHKGIYCRINPEITYHDHQDIFDQLIALGYHHTGFNQLHENNEPRFTFRRYFKNYESHEAIDQSLSKSFLQTVKRSFHYPLKVTFNDALDNFYELNYYNALRDAFYQHPKSFFEALGNHQNVNIVTISVNGHQLYEQSYHAYLDLQTKLNQGLVPTKQIPDAKDQLARLQRECSMFARYSSSDELSICKLINGVQNQRMWTMYIGNNALAQEVFAINRIYYETIHYCFDHGYEFLDLYGTIGKCDDFNHPLVKLHQFKKKFGDEYLEFMGDFDLVIHPLLYRLLPHLLKIYRHMKRGH